jgi:hypothetical protein
MNREETWGALYGLPPQTFLTMISSAFPGKRLGFVSSDEFSQDVYLREYFVSETEKHPEKYSRCSVVNIIVDKNTEEQEKQADIFFGRYTVSPHIEQFVASTAKPFVGSNVMNVYQGAILSLGADDREEGRRLAIRILAPIVIGQGTLARTPMLAKNAPVIGVNLRARAPRAFPSPLNS